MYYRPVSIPLVSLISPLCSQRFHSARTNMVSSPAIVPTTSCQSGASTIRRPWAARNCLYDHYVYGIVHFKHRFFEYLNVPVHKIAVMGLYGRILVPVSARVYKPQLLDISRHRRLGYVNPQVLSSSARFLWVSISLFSMSSILACRAIFIANLLFFYLLSLSFVASVVSFIHAHHVS